MDRPCARRSVRLMWQLAALSKACVYVSNDGNSYQKAARHRLIVSKMEEHCHDMKRKYGRVMPRAIADDPASLMMRGRARAPHHARDENPDRLWDANNATRKFCRHDFSVVWAEYVPVHFMLAFLVLRFGRTMQLLRNEFCLSTRCVSHNVVLRFRRMQMDNAASHSGQRIGDLLDELVLKLWARGKGTAGASAPAAASSDTAAAPGDAASASGDAAAGTEDSAAASAESAAPATEESGTVAEMEAAHAPATDELESIECAAVAGAAGAAGAAGPQKRVAAGRGGPRKRRRGSTGARGAGRGRGRGAAVPHALSDAADDFDETDASQAGVGADGEEDAAARPVTMPDSWLPTAWLACIFNGPCAPVDQRDAGWCPVLRTGPVLPSEQVTPVLPLTSFLSALVYAMAY